MLRSLEGVQKFKSLKRAIKKGLVSEDGIVYPKRPFNNRKNKPVENKKREIYADIKKRFRQ